ncbi:hypothetical protein BX281_10174 [Streptomyces sp. Ag82_O1-15]|nr:hypothetical protein BX281_10174 [Streptomyces sp. Ag82_O1-15]
MEQNPNGANHHRLNIPCSATPHHTQFARKKRAQTLDVSLVRAANFFRDG